MKKESTYEELREENAHLKERIAYLERMLYGSMRDKRMPSSEDISPGLFDDFFEEALAEKTKEAEKAAENIKRESEITIKQHPNITSTMKTNKCLYKVNIILLFLFCLVCLPETSLGQTLHTIIFADTNDDSIGEGVSVNVRNIQNWSRMISESLHKDGYTLKTYVFSGYDCNKENLLAFLNDFSCQNDIVIFYYGGHGGRSVHDSSKYPRICLSANEENRFVKLSDIEVLLKSKNPKLQIIIADCCNSYYNGNVPMSRPMPMGTYSRQSSYDESLIRELFLNNNGSIICTGATKGEYGWISSIDGGFFTQSFLNSFGFAMNRKEEQPLWRTIMSDASDETYYLSYSAYIARQINTTQRPVFDVNLNSNKPTQDNGNYVRIPLGNGYYYGEVKNGKRHGIGALYFDNGERFEGNWINDEICGSGIYFWPNGSYFSGYWDSSRRNGYGIEVKPNGTYSIHYFVDEKSVIRVVANRSRLNYANGYYIGQVLNGKAHGMGTYYWNDGSKFEGNWVNGVIHGNGLLTYSNNQGVYVGYWDNGIRKECYGLQCLNNGQKLIGYWKNEIYRGKSFIILTNKRRLDN